MTADPPHEVDAGILGEVVELLDAAPAIVLCTSRQLSAP